MKLQLQRKDSILLLQTPANFAKEKGVDRKYVYQLIKEDLVDFVEVDGVMFVYLNKKAKDYSKTRYL